MTHLEASGSTEHIAAQAQTYNTKSNQVTTGGNKSHTSSQKNQSIDITTQHNEADQLTEKPADVWT